MKRWVLWLVIPALTIASGACDECTSARREAVDAWDEVVMHALDVAAEWGETEVQELTKGRYGIPEVAAKERARWVKALEKAKEARQSVAHGRDFLPVVKKAYDYLSVMEAPRFNKDWQGKLSHAKKAAYLVDSACPK